MGAITIRNLDDGVIERMKAEAARRGRSMEEEARSVLTERYPASYVAEWVERLDRFRAEHFPDGESGVDVVELVREGRETLRDGERL